MNRNRDKRVRRNENKKQKKIIRCKALNRPVFGDEHCFQFVSKVAANHQNNCENCKHAF